MRHLTLALLALLSAHVTTVLAAESGLKYEWRGEGPTQYFIADLGGARVAVTRVNPVAGTNAELNRFFDDSHRPVMWEEAKNACDHLTTDSLKWRLPRTLDVKVLSSINIIVHLEDRKNYAAKYWPYRDLGTQFKYFWTQDGTEDNKPGLKMAARYEYPVTVVSHTERKPLNFVCVANTSPGV